MDVTVYIFCGLVLAFLWYISSSRRKGNVIPGPAGWPVLGCLSCISIKNMHHRFYEYAEKYGDIMKIEVLGTKIVALNTVELAQSAFNGEKYKTQLNDRPCTFYGQNILNNKGIVFTLDGNSPVHSKLRKIFAQGFHVYGDGIKLFEEKVMQQIVILNSSIEAKMCNDFDLMNELKRSLSNLLSIFLSGDPLYAPGDTSEENIFWELDAAADFVASPSADAVYTVAPFIRFLPGVYKEKYQRVIDAADKIQERYLANTKATYTEGTVRGIVDFLLNEQMKELASGNDVILSDLTLRSMLLELVGGGIITTYSTLCNLFFCLMRHPKYQEMARDELNHVIGNQRLPSLEDRPNCPLIEAIILETMRLLPTVPFGGPHTNKSHMEFDGYDLPAKSMIFVNVWYIHHNPKIWGDPWAFRPERFLDDSGHLLSTEHPFRKSWIPFGLGRRQCVGESLARSRMFLYTASLLQRWTFIQSTEQMKSCDPRSEDFEVHATMRPKSVVCRVEAALPDKQTII